MKCPNGHDMVPASKAPGGLPDHVPEDWSYCGECPYRDGAGGILGYGIFYSPDELQQNGQAQTSEAHS